MYNLITISNTEYYPFVESLIGSLFKNSNINNLNKLYIVDAGTIPLSTFIEPRNKIEIIQANSCTFEGVHSNGWLNTTRLKTKYVLECLKNINNDIPLIMIDADTYILKDFYTVINPSYDIQFTTMVAGEQLNAAGIPIKEIASFVVFNNILKSISFLELWIDKIRHLEATNIRPPFETPALNIVIRENKLGLNFGYLKESIVCSDLIIYPESLVLHLKSVGSSNDNPILNFYKRLKYVQYRNSNLTPRLILDQINKDKLKQWEKLYE